MLQRSSVNFWLVLGDVLEIMRLAPADALDVWAIFADITSANFPKLQADMAALIDDAPEAAAAIQKLLTDLGI